MAILEAGEMSIVNICMKTIGTEENNMLRERSVLAQPDLSSKHSHSSTTVRSTHKDPFLHRPALPQLVILFMGLTVLVIKEKVAYSFPLLLLVVNYSLVFIVLLPYLW